MEIQINPDKWLIYCLLVVLAVVFIVDANTLIKSPISFGDEGFHTRVAQWFAQKKDYFAWTPFFGKASLDGMGRPVLWNLTEAGFFLVLGFHEIIPKLLIPMIAVLTGLATFTFVTKLYGINVGLSRVSTYNDAGSANTYRGNGRGGVYLYIRHPDNIFYVLLEET